MVVLDAEMESEPKIEVVLTVDIISNFNFEYISKQFTTLKYAHSKKQTNS
jgi:hypothetical protein